MFALIVASCGREPMGVMPAKTWEDITIQVETRPPLLEKGMNEFLVIATKLDRRPAHNLLVSLRINEDGQWHQAIQDGEVGVYRRAINTAMPKTDVLFVRIARDNREGIFEFPLAEQKPR
jgi:hypothetical protein